MIGSWTFLKKLMDLVKPINLMLMPPLKFISDSLNFLPESRHIWNLLSSQGRKIQTRIFKWLLKLIPTVAFQDHSTIINKFKILIVWLWISPVSIYENFHTVPHLKALINGIDTSSGQREGSFYIKTITLGKNWFQYIKRDLSGSLFVGVHIKIY